mmetsp:Transcript_1697/g.5163  ORF Transcript_1697/g.5163 Transcript_1697/m.5163 type:complete len:81 (-) Transcript_1697:117-359(-)
MATFLPSGDPTTDVLTEEISSEGNSLKAAETDEGLNPTLSNMSAMERTSLGTLKASVFDLTIFDSSTPCTCLEKALHARL